METEQAEAHESGVWKDLKDEEKSAQYIRDELIRSTDAGFDTAKALETRGPLGEVLLHMACIYNRQEIAKEIIALQKVLTLHFTHHITCIESSKKKN